MYSVLLRACVSFTLAIIAYQLNDEVQDDVVNFVLEKGGTKPDHARQLFQRFKTDPLADPMLRWMLDNLDFGNKNKRVESECGAVAVGRTYLLPPLSSGGALVVQP